MSDNGKNRDDDFDPADFDFGGSEAKSSSASAGDDFNFDFATMPTPGGGNKKPANPEPVFATPVQDGGFDDDGDDDAFSPGGFRDEPEERPAYAQETGFAPAGEAFDEPEYVDTADGFDADAGAADDDTFVVEGEQEEEEVLEEGAGDERSIVQKYGFHAGVAIAAVVIGYIGYTMVLPSLIGGQAPVPVVQQPQAVQNAPVDAPLPDFMANVTPNGPVGLPADPSGQVAAADQNLPGLPTAQPEGDAPGLPSLDLSDAAVDTPFPAQPEAVNTDVSGRLAAIEAEVRSLSESELVQRIASLEDRLAALESQPALAATPRPAVEPPSKPLLVDGWVLRGIQGDVAWVEGPSGLVEVKRGTEIPGAGLVEDMTQYEGEWMVITAGGIIKQN